MTADPDRPARNDAMDLTSGHALAPRLAEWPDQGVYQLFIRLPRRVRVRVGRLGVFEFPPGRYVYTGRASRGLRARLRRHLRREKKRHWHVDYLLAADGARVEVVRYVSADADDECRANLAAGRRRVSVAAGFGASDCRAGCKTHLWHLPAQCAVRSGPASS